MIQYKKELLNFKSIRSNKMSSFKIIYFLIGLSLVKSSPVQPLNNDILGYNLVPGRTAQLDTQYYVRWPYGIVPYVIDSSLSIF